MAKHTPGPWLTYKDGFACTYPENRFAEIEIRNSDHVIIASSRKRDMPQSEHAANVRLIASAPELLAALEAIHAHGYTNANDYEMVRDAIAKATGAVP